jgi:hypothetical protein
MEYAVVTVSGTYHIGNTSTGMTLCDQPQDTWETMLNTRNKSLIGCYSLVVGRSSSCKSCESQGAASVKAIYA